MTRTIIQSFILPTFFLLFFASRSGGAPTEPVSWTASFILVLDSPGGRLNSDQLIWQMNRRGLSLRDNADGTRSLEADPALTGLVRILVRDPDGRPLANVAVNVRPSLDEDHGTTALVLSGLTDLQGRLTIPAGQGVQSVKISVPGAGLGQTGYFELRAGATIDVPLPPLAAFASVEGTLDPAIKSSRGKVALSSAFTSYGHVDTDKAGHFIVRELPAGPCNFQFRSAAVGSEAAVESASAWTQLMAGETVHLVLRHHDFQSPDRDEPDRLANAGLKIPDELVRGVVRDAAGAPVKNAVVTVIDGGTPVSSTTDGVGRYAIHNESEGNRACLIVLRVAGHAMRVVPRLLNPMRGVPPYELNWVVPGPGGTLEVRIIRDGVPQPQIRVTLDIGDIWNLWGFHQLDQAESMRRLLIPDATTDVSGICRFTDLPAGAFNISFEDGDRFLATSRARGIQVPEGRTVRIDLPDYVRSGSAGIRFQSADGRRLPLRRVQRFEAATWTGSGDARNLLESSTGLFAQRWNVPGLMSLCYRFRDTPLSTNSDPDTEPFYEGAAMVAGSRLLDHFRPIDITVRRCEPGSLKVQILGLDGKPVQGTVLIPAWAGDFGHGATTDIDGTVIFEGMRPQVYPVYFQIPGRHAPAEITASTDDAALTDVTMVPVKTVRIIAGQQCRIVAQQQAVSYLRGAIVPPAGHSASEYQVQRLIPDERFLGKDGNPPSYAGNANVLFDEKSDDILVGPLTSASESFTIVRVKGIEWPISLGSQKVPLAAGRVTHVDFHPVEPAANPTYVGCPQFGALELGRESPAEISVVGSDGKTPIAGARVETFLPQMWWPYLTGVSDSSGLAHIWALGEGGAEPMFQPPGSPSTPFVIAWLPGTNGAAVAPIGPLTRQITLVLPQPITCPGRVTVAGKSPERLDAVIHVLAAHDAAGKLERAMNIETTCSADGTFELLGLTPGKYRVQATLDDVWLSTAVEFTADDKSPTAPISLNIESPGVGVAIHLLGVNGPVTAPTRIGIERPAGPMAARLWPSDFESDAAGTIYLEGLEAGDHALILPDGRRETISVPPSDDDHQLPADVDVHLNAAR